MKRTPLKRGKGLALVSKKRKTYRQSREGKAAVMYMMAVKSLPCCITGAPPPNDAHHCISGRYSAFKASDWDVIPLCKEEHQDGPKAIHNGKASWEARNGLDTNYIARTRAAVKARFPNVFDEWI